MCHHGSAVCSWCVLLNKCDLLTCVWERMCVCVCVYMCVCVCVCVIGQPGSTLSPQTGRSLCRVWCHNLSDVHLPTGTFGQENHIPARVCVSTRTLVYSHHGPSNKTALSLDWWLSSGEGGRGGAIERELIMHRGFRTVTAQTRALQLLHRSRCFIVR